MRHARIKEIELCFAKYRNVCFFFTHGILVDAEITKDFTHTLSEIINEFNKIVESKVNT